MRAHDSADSGERELAAQGFEIWLKNLGHLLRNCRYICAMHRNAFFTLAILACMLLLGACKTSESSAKPGKWIPYTEQTLLKERQLRAQLKVEKREAMSSMMTDSGEVWYPSEVTRYNTFGQPTLSQLLDASGVVTKETRSTYQDSLLTREVITEASGYSSSMDYKYNALHQKVEELIMQRGDSLLKRSYKLDEYGNEMEVQLERYREHAHLQLMTKRDPLGQPISVTELQDGKPNWTETYQITDTLWRIKRTDGQNKVQGDYEMHIANDAVTQMINRGPDGKTRMSIFYTNDAQGRVIKEQYVGMQGQPMQGTEFKYDAQGLPSERILISPTVAEKLVTRYTYTFRK
jgi:hypothetical protein